MAEKTKKTATKKVAKKVATKKVAKKCAKKSTTKTSVKVCSKKITRVIAKINVGWGNSLFIRGAGAELSWDKGVAMQCIGDDEWLWEQYVPKGDVSFKFLINDSQWSVGEDFVVAVGDSVICNPIF